MGADDDDEWCGHQYSSSAKIDVRQVSTNVFDWEGRSFREQAAVNGYAGPAEWMNYARLELKPVGGALPNLCLIAVDYLDSPNTWDFLRSPGESGALGVTGGCQCFYGKAATVL
jgi:hypothetical protein